MFVLNILWLVALAIMCRWLWEAFRWNGEVLSAGEGDSQRNPDVVLGVLNVVAFFSILVGAGLFCCAIPLGPQLGVLVAAAGTYLGVIGVAGVLCLSGELWRRQRRQQGGPATTPAIGFAAGQVWSYHTRPGEEGSRLIIGRVDSAVAGEMIVHVMVTGVRLQTPRNSRGVTSTIAHLPISEQAMRKSILQQLSEAHDLAGFEEGYSTWLTERQAGNAGVFAIPLSRVISYMEAVLNQ